ncbi:class I SAM-dependent methyltransferase family protein [Halosimplex rubrum]|uniref:tRNA(Phe) (4-demethylwyosine(37)-C(7)) aminocarboxypropyltransferase n=1 Tax=Halosimplex rubrum TaxID=869889 RepID=A0A7D5P2N5_9EURY|nr:class I SAM-dependent methyltransferase family protein [Halosimplex rubrum]QLH76022.1 class I SAM-dependent methyltransferase family protein [Halosimplex rubrum]
MDERDDRLAVVVDKPRAEAVIDDLERAGVYDADRSVREFDEGSVSLPVTAVPEAVDYREVVRQVGEPRLRDLADHLRERGWTDEEVELAPSSWAVLGTVVLVDIGDAPRPAELGEALLDLHGAADTVLARGPVTGAHREPDVTVLAGEGDTETVHREHGTTYAMDLAEVMFSPGNKAERARMGDEVSEGERVVDMFAGIGYFALPMARAGADVTAIERNPASFEFLLENVRRNGVTDRVQPYRADCRDVLRVAAEPPRTDEVGDADPAQVDSATDVRADRVVMGHYDASEPRSEDSRSPSDASHEYLDSALGALEPGGVVHMHEATPETLVPDRPVERLRAAAAERGRSVDVLETRRVKGYSEGVAHVVVDARVE